MTNSGYALIALENGNVQIGSYVFDPSDADIVAAFIEDSKKFRVAIDAGNTKSKKTNTPSS